MKKFGIIATLVVALLGTITLINKVAADTSEMTLQLTEGNLTCTAPDSVDMWTTGTSISAQVMSNDTWSGNIICDDNSTVARGAAITLQLTTALDNSNGSTIAGSHVEVNPTGGTLSATAWGTNCLAAIAAGTSTGTLNSTVDILTKSTAGSGEACSFTLVGWAMDLTVNVPAYQAAGSYTGTLTISFPSI